MRIYFIRHAQSTNNRLWDETGSSDGRSQDPHLTDLGAIQAQTLANYLAEQHLHSPDESGDIPKRKPITHIYSSLMWRALQTADYAACRLNLPIYGLKDLHESGGIYLKDAHAEIYHGLPGKTPLELRTSFSRLQLIEPINPDGWWNAPFEPDEAVMSRAQRLVEWIFQTHGGSDDQIVLFSHGGFFNYFFAALMGQSELLPAWFVLNNTGRCCMDVSTHGCAVRYMNRLDHLPEEHIS